MVDGSSRWLIGRNVTLLCNHLQINDNRLQLPLIDETQDYITLINNETHSFIPLCPLMRSQSLSKYHSCSVMSLVGHSVRTSVSSENSETLARPLNEITRIVQRVHDHVCEHASYGDVRTLLQRNKLWNNDVQRYVASTVEKCPNCIAAAPPATTRKVSISGINRCFNDVVFVDHFWLDDICLFHAMDSFSRFSIAQPVTSTAISEVIVAFENLWISHFWPPSQVQGDLAFRFPKFTDFLAKCNISFRPVPPRRHHKNLLEPKHGVIRAVYLRLKSASPSENTGLLTVSAVRISNELYGSDTMSSFELAKGYTKPIDDSFFPQGVSEDIVAAHEELVAKRKLTLLLRSKATQNPLIKSGDLVQVYYKDRSERRGKWSSPRTVLSFDPVSGIVSIPGSNGSPIHAAVEDVRHAVTEDELAVHVTESIDQINSEIDAAITDSSALPDTSPSISNTDLVGTGYNPDFDNDDDDTNAMEYNNIENAAAPLPLVGDHIVVLWPEDNLYYPGVITSINDIGQHVTNYDDGDREELNMCNETWRSDSTLNANATSLPSLKSNVQGVLKDILDTLGNKPFMRHHAQSFPQYVLYNAYEAEESEFKKQVECVSIADVPPDANIIASHTIYKIKIAKTNSLRLKARIAPHGNEDSHKNMMKSDCAMRSPVGIRIVLTTAATRRWPLIKADVKSAFLQTGKAERHVYVRSPRESRDKRHYWLLLAAAYGLVNANAKFQVQADELITSIGLSHMAVVP